MIYQVQSPIAFPNKHLLLFVATSNNTWHLTCFAWLRQKFSYPAHFSPWVLWLEDRAFPENQGVTTSHPSRRWSLVILV